MRTFLRWLGYGLVVLLILILLAAAWIWFASSRELGRRYTAASENLIRAPAQLAEAPARRACSAASVAMARACAAG